ncbi:VanW family protein [Cytobacillus praedii]|uniref:Vancomycin resistance protein n=1 Tax=Cytobacillus praedii TaxID=1742358 RepID=A0A4R1AT80_9BACI|nr:VanW family protein [Cytobacillus praedii]TCJ03240.1 vancomycin resistance protein [Cytobacillus praedii]
MNPVNLRPKQRSKSRIRVGTWFYTIKRYIEWITDGKKYAKQKTEELLPYLIAEHQTILFRKLKGVEMSLQRNKITNLQTAVPRVKKIIIHPGETFSYWQLIGKPTYNKGYTDGMVLYYGKFKTGVGGGLCQLSNLIYWMTLHSPLTVIERHRHSYDVFPDSNRTQPFGSGATCAYNYLDLQIKNETNIPYQIHLQLTGTHLVGEWRASEPALYTYEVYEKRHEITPAYWGGYLRHNEIYRRKFNRQKQLICDEFVTENHAVMMYEPLLESKGNIIL